MCVCVCVCVCVCTYVCVCPNSVNISIYHNVCTNLYIFTLQLRQATISNLISVQSQNLLNRYKQIDIRTVSKIQINMIILQMLFNRVLMGIWRKQSLDV